MNAGLIGAVAGSLLGVTGGLIGTWASVRNTNGPRERAFMVRVAIAGWIGFLLLVALLLLLPQTRLWLWIPFTMLLPLGIRSGNRKQMEIRRDEREKV